MNKFSTKYLQFVDMSEAFDNAGVMMLLHHKIMRDAEVAAAYQLMVANPDLTKSLVIRKGNTNGG